MYVHLGPQTDLVWNSTIKVRGGCPQSYDWCPWRRREVGRPYQFTRRHNRGQSGETASSRFSQLWRLGVRLGALLSFAAPLRSSPPSTQDMWRCPCKAFACGSLCQDRSSHPHPCRLAPGWPDASYPGTSWGDQGGHLLPGASCCAPQLLGQCPAREKHPANRTG